MKRLMIALILIVLLVPLSALPSTEISQRVVSASAERLQNLLDDVQNKIQSIAESPYAKSGSWLAIKSEFMKMSKDLPGDYFWVTPDGHYYSLERDFSNLNLRDRGYFQPLFEGKTVKGFPVYSRASGKKGAVFVSPVIKDNKAISGIGVSIYLDDLHHRINREQGITEDVTWFVIDKDGLTMLDKDIDFIYMNALTQGTQSLTHAMTRALRSDVAKIEYEIGGTFRTGYSKKLQGLDWWLIMAKKSGGDAPSTPKLNISLQTFIPELNEQLGIIDRRVSKLLAESTGKLNAEADIRDLLHASLGEYSAVVEAVYVDNKGVMRYIEPPEFRPYEGTDISKQQHQIDLMASRKPVLSSGFRVVEGFLGVVLAHPVLDQAGNIQGSINLVIRPELIIQSIVKNTEIPEETEIWIMQTDGMIVYDNDPGEIGRMLFTDHLYSSFKGLLDLGRKIVAAPSGKGEYIFQARGGSDKVLKNAVWETVVLQGREWRVILASRAN